MEKSIVVKVIKKRMKTIESEAFSLAYMIDINNEKTDLFYLRKTLGVIESQVKKLKKFVPQEV